MIEGDAARSEECDDGNLEPGDGCSATCTRE
jgi:cysteine-rich repeat protein